MSDIEQLLELHIISAQDLAPVTRQMRTYAVTWIHSARKLSTCVDTGGHTNPTWNDKFVFRVNPNFLSNEMSVINVDIYAIHWFRNIRVGTVRLILGNLFPPSDLRRRNRHGTRFVALQVRRPSGRPQGILNVGASILDGGMRGLKLYRQLSASAVGFKDLMDDNNSHLHRILSNDKINKQPVLQRSRSDRSELERKPALELEDDLLGSEARKLNRLPSSSTSPSGSDLIFQPKKRKQKQVRSRSIVSDSIDPERNKINNKSRINSNQIRSRLSIMSMSELGPSPSEVVEEARRRNPTALTETSEEPSMLDESVEGLRSKMDRWRFDFEPTNEKANSNETGTFSSNARTKHIRRHTDGSSGLFSCFGNVCGYECTIVCGRPTESTDSTNGPIGFGRLDQT
uniref:C2 domain-containing protein n=1 Tax=Kalanchoe fedtschenkoi TaxID=63787 RepID=A0A7N0USQ8_KALFE